MRRKGSEERKVEVGMSTARGGRLWELWEARSGSTPCGDVIFPSHGGSLPYHTPPEDSPPSFPTFLLSLPPSSTLFPPFFPPQLQFIKPHGPFSFLPSLTFPFLLLPLAAALFTSPRDHLRPPGATCGRGAADRQIIITWNGRRTTPGARHALQERGAALPHLPEG